MSKQIDIGAKLYRKLGNANGAGFMRVARQETYEEILKRRLLPPPTWISEIVEACTTYAEKRIRQQQYQESEVFE